MTAFYANIIFPSMSFYAIWLFPNDKKVHILQICHKDF